MRQVVQSCPFSDYGKRKVTSRYTSLYREHVTKKQKPSLEYSRLYFKRQHCTDAERETKFFALLGKTLISRSNNSSADLLGRKKITNVQIKTKQEENTYIHYIGINALPVCVRKN